MNKKITALVAVLCAGTLGLTGCSSDSTENTDSADSANSSAQTATPTDAGNTELESTSISLADGYCRAKDEQSDMTACFGTLTNPSSFDITVESFTAPDLEGASTELHEVVDGKMRQKKGGFSIPAGGSQELAPGGEHLMIMNYTDPIQAGETLSINLVMGDGSEFTAEFPVREQPSGEEDYAGGEHDSHGQHH
ncbi:copper chaperone PCu(A)C [Corynebacterium sp. 20_84]